MTHQTNTHTPISGLRSRSLTESARQVTPPTCTTTQFIREGIYTYISFLLNICHLLISTRDQPRFREHTLKPLSTFLSLQPPPPLSPFAPPPHPFILDRRVVHSFSPLHSTPPPHNFLPPHPHPPFSSALLSSPLCHFPAYREAASVVGQWRDTYKHESTLCFILSLSLSLSLSPPFSLPFPCVSQWALSPLLSASPPHPHPHPPYSSTIRPLRVYVVIYTFFCFSSCCNLLCQWFFLFIFFDLVFLLFYPPNKNNNSNKQKKKTEKV